MYFPSMEVLKLTGRNGDEIIRAAVAVLRRGGVVLYPTDTCYGFAVDIFNEPAFRKLYRLKDMSYKKPVSIMVSSLDEAKRYGQFFELASDISEKFWPGPLTLVVDKKSSLPSFLNLGVDTIGIRLVDFPFVCKLVETYGLPLTTTSANISGRKESYSLAEFRRHFKSRSLLPDLAIDGGALPRRSPSTVVAVSDDAVQFIREGSLARKLKNYMKQRNKR